MKTATVILAIGLLALLGCSGQTGKTPLPQVAEMTQRTVAAEAEPPVPPATITPSEDEIEKEVQKRLPHGPADPHYRDPEVGQANPALAVAFADGLRFRNWPSQTTQFSNGKVSHMPLWFADPVETKAIWGDKDMSVLAAVYCPARFIVNLVALPVTVFVHPVWENTVTDRTGDVGATATVLHSDLDPNRPVPFDTTVTTTQPTAKGH
ncbi:MAG: hypothetical protein PHU85_06745 [Phycisphaerae bacterium]|nr:hypothetical protein [Phycisphaerae bacterium]